MKKLLVIIALLITVNSFSQYFDGIHISGDAAAVMQKFRAKGYRLIKTESNAYAMKGEANGVDVELYLLATPITKKAYSVKVYLSEKISWYSLKSEYNRFKDILTNKYGSNDKDYEYFEEPYFEGDGYETSAVKLEKVHYLSFWFDNQNTNLCIEITKWMQVCITYENATAAEVNKKEKEKKESNTF